MDKEFLTDDEAAALLNRSRAWLYHQERRDPSFPRKVRIPGGRFTTARRRSELITWIDSLARVEQDGIDVVTKRKQAC
jgi:predicted DNA-binding transcriptional regulator AlpA